MAPTRCVWNTTSSGTVAFRGSGDPFVSAPERLWRDVLRRQRGRLALFSTYPEDATVN